MTKYIPLDALIAEIKKEIKIIYAGREYVGIPSWDERKIDGLEKAIEILDTLEVKKVNFKDIKSVFEGQYLNKDNVITTIEKLQDECEEKGDNNGIELLEKLFNKLDTLKVEKVYLNKESLEKLRNKVQDALLKSAIEYYEACRACCEIAVPQQQKDDLKKAYDEFIWRCQDYEIVNESDSINLEDLEYDYQL